MSKLSLFRKCWFQFIVVLAFFLCSFSFFAAAEEVTKCDTTFASPHDSGRRATGVPLEKIDWRVARKVIPVCKEVLARRPDSTRDRFQFARSMLTGVQYPGYWEALDEMQKLADEGFLAAQLDFAYMKLNGFRSPTGGGLRPSPSVAKKYYSLAAEKENPIALYNMGKLSEEDDEKQALEYYSRAAKAGDVESQYEMGYRNLYGRGTPQNKEYAIGWLQIASSNGHLKARSVLAQVQQQNTGYSDRELRITKVTHEAAKAGSAKAQYNLGVMYEYGKGVPQNDDEAYQWYWKAAGNGVGKAYYALGRFYLAGRSVRQDDGSAQAYFRMAADKDPEIRVESIKAANSIREQMLRQAERDRYAASGQRPKVSGAQILATILLIGMIMDDGSYSTGSPTLNDPGFKPYNACNDPLVTEFMDQSFC